MNYSSKKTVGGVFDIFSANVSAGLSSSTSIDFSNYTKAGFLNCYSYAEFLNYQVLEYGNTHQLSQMLSSNFLKLIKREGIYSNYSDEAIAKAIIKEYGTHLILGVKTGGRMDYYYSFATNNEAAALDFKNQIELNASLGIEGIIGASSKTSFGTEYSTSISKNETKNDLILQDLWR